MPTQKNKKTKRKINRKRKIKPPARPGQRWHAMISYTQRDPKSETLAHAIYSGMTKRGKKVWLDVKMAKRDEAAMQNGVEHSDFIIAIVSGPPGDDSAYFKRPLCLKELRWAKENGTPVVPVVSASDKDNITEFFADIPDDLQHLKRVNWEHIDRKDIDYFSLGLDKILKTSAEARARAASQPGRGRRKLNRKRKINQNTKKNNKTKGKGKNKCIQVLMGSFKNYDLLDPKRNKQQLINRIINDFNTKGDILNKKYNYKSKGILYKYCAPPKDSIENGKKLIAKLDKIDIELSNHDKGMFRILWTGWIQLSQLVACFIANYISNHYVNSRAIEQTNFTKKWTGLCGTWESERKMIKEILKKNIGAKNSNRGQNIIDSEAGIILKNIWDRYSILFSRHNKLPNTVIIIPENIDKNILNKTLVKIELNNLNTSKVCVVMFKNIGGYIINPHLRGNQTDIDGKVTFEFKTWNAGAKRSIINFLKKNKGK